MERLLTNIWLIGFILIILSSFLLIYAYLKDLSFKKGIIWFLSGFTILMMSFYTGEIWKEWSIKFIVGIIIVILGIITFLSALLVLLSDGKNPVIRRKCLGLFLITAMLAVIGDSLCSWFQ